MIEVIKIQELSGRKASIYSILIGDGSKSTELEDFFETYRDSHKNELQDILIRLQSMSEDVGVREQYFNMNKGKVGDGVCDLRQRPNGKLRLYCIRFSNQIVIVGGGGEKQTRKLQDDPKLKQANYLLRWLSNEMFQRVLDKEIAYSEDGLNLIGNLKFEKHGNW